MSTPFLVNRYCSEARRIGQGMNPLILASEANDVDGVRALLSNDAIEWENDTAREFMSASVAERVNMSSENFHAGSPPLHIAAMKGHFAVASILIENRANVAIGNDNCTPALHLAAEKGHTTTANLLIQNNANVNAKSWSGRTALHYAASYHHKDLVSLLISHGASVNEPTYEENVTPLHDAAGVGDAAIVSLLIAHGANPEAEDEKKMTPLHHAQIRGHEEIIRLLRWQCFK